MNNLILKVRLDKGTEQISHKKDTQNINKYMKNTRYIHLGRILLSDNSKKLVIHGTTWMNVKSFILSERNQIHNISIDYVCSIYRKSENRFLKIYIDRKSGDGREKLSGKGHKRTF